VLPKGLVSLAFVGILLELCHCSTPLADFSHKSTTWMRRTILF
jgi:hypothetical protein